MQQLRHLVTSGGLCALWLWTSACGGKDPAPAPPEPAGRVAVGAPPVVGALDAGAPMTTPGAAPGGTAAPTEPGGTAPGTEPGGTAPGTEPAAPGEPFVAPPGTPVVRGVEPEVVARLMTGEVGCVALAKNGRALVSIVEAEEGKVLLVQATSGDPESWPLGPDPAALLADEAVAKALRSKALAPCRRLAPEGGAVVVPKTVPVTLRETDEGWVEAAIAGNRPVVVRRKDAPSGAKLVEVYWSEAVGALWVRLRDADDPEHTYLEAVAAHTLGESACVPRPRGGKAPEVTEPPPFSPKPPKLNCVAMTPDGRKAAFKIFFVSHVEEVASRPNAITWFGPGAEPDIDLSCMLRGCAAADLERVTADAARLGLVGCAQTRNQVVVDGQVTPLMTGGDAVLREESVVLKTTGGWRPVHKLRIGAEGEGREEVWSVFQLPAGGPIYFYVGDRDGGVEKVDVAVVDEASMNLCPAPPAGALPVREVLVSAAQRDVGGYRFGAANLVDGDLTSGWQAPSWKAGQPAPWVELVLDGARTVSAVEIANGWQRRDGQGDLFVANARASAATLSFADGSVEEVALPDARGLHRITLATPRTTDRVKVEFKAIVEGQLWPRDLSIAEIRVFGP